MSIKYAKFTTMLEHLFAALYMSENWHTLWLEHKDSRDRRFRRLAIYGRARAAVLFDRVLNGELR